MAQPEPATLILCQCDNVNGCINCKGNVWRTGHYPFGMHLELALCKDPDEDDEDNNDTSEYYEATPRVIERWNRIFVTEQGVDPRGMALKTISEDDRE